METREESILEKSIRVLGDSRDLGRLFRAIAEGGWTPTDAAALKSYEDGLKQ
jgi:hypothetical protein